MNGYDVSGTFHDFSNARLSSGGAKTCYFGGIDHIKKLMRNGMFNYVEFTELGRAIMGV